MLKMKKSKNLEFEPLHPKKFSLLPWYTEFPVYLEKCYTETEFQTLIHLRN
jgi:hypothetical protein